MRAERDRDLMDEWVQCNTCGAFCPGLHQHAPGQSDRAATQDAPAFAHEWVQCATCRVFSCGTQHSCSPGAGWDAFGFGQYSQIPNDPFINLDPPLLNDPFLNLDPPIIDPLVLDPTLLVDPIIDPLVLDPTLLVDPIIDLGLVL